MSSSNFNIESSNFEKKTPNNGIDSTISNLKSRLFDLEQQEKDRNALAQKLSNLKKNSKFYQQQKTDLNKNSNKKTTHTTKKLIACEMIMKTYN